MTVVKAMSAIFGAFGRTFIYLVALAIMGAVFSVMGGLLVADAAKGALGEGSDNRLDTLALLAPAMLAHAAFLIVVSRLTVSPFKKLPPFGMRQGFGIALLTVIIAVTTFGFSWLPEPIPFFVPLLMAAGLAWTPIIPAFAGGASRWSMKSFGVAVLVSLPFLALCEILGALPQAAFTLGEGIGIMEGGAIMFPLLGLHLWLATVTAAIISTVVYATPQPHATAILS